MLSFATQTCNFHSGKKEQGGSTFFSLRERLNEIQSFKKDVKQYKFLDFVNVQFHFLKLSFHFCPCFMRHFYTMLFGLLFLGTPGN